MALLFPVGGRLRYGHGGLHFWRFLRWTHSPPTYAATVERLSGPGQQKWDALLELRAAGDAAIPAVFDGMSHPDWQIRRGCAIYVDHEPDPQLMQRLVLLLNDPKAKVRMWAVHSIGCEPCKPGGNPLDAVPLLIRAMLEDKAPRVRRMAVLMLMQQAPERRIVRAYRRALARETDAKAIRFLNYGLKRLEAALAPAP